MLIWCELRHALTRKQCRFLQCRRVWRPLSCLRLPPCSQLCSPTHSKVVLVLSPKTTKSARKRTTNKHNDLNKMMQHITFSPQLQKLTQFFRSHHQTCFLSKCCSKRNINNQPSIRKREISHLEVMKQLNSIHAAIHVFSADSLGRLHALVDHLVPRLQSTRFVLYFETYDHNRL